MDTKIKGIDISSWQGNVDLRQALGITFAWIKLTEGKYYENPYAGQQIASARAAGMLVGFYHFMAGSDAVAEANHFADVAARFLQDGDTLWDDFEINYGGDKDAYNADFIRQVNNRLGVKAGLYINDSTKRSDSWDAVRGLDAALWDAMYGSNSGNPEGDGPASEPWPVIAAWQYTSNGTVGGVGGRVDMNIFFGNRDTLYKYGKNGATPAETNPQPEPVVPTIPPSASTGFYKIAHGDTFWGIETQFNWAHGTLQALNPGVKPRELQPGQIVNIPNGNGADDGKSGDVYIIQWGDTLSGIAAKFGVSIDAIANANGIVFRDKISAGGSLVIPHDAAPSTPQSGDVYIQVPSGIAGYLSSLAHAYGSTVEQIVTWNRDKYPSIGSGNDAHIEAGWTIRVR